MLKEKNKTFNNIKSKILEYIKEKEEIYLVSPTTIIKDYNAENRLKDDYQKREILEMLQNAEDATASEVFIDLDTAKQEIKIFNNGDKFSANGYRNIIFDEVSPKDKSKNIGNKGLGFRSLLNWAEEITIDSNGLKLIFSEENAQAKLEKIKTISKKDYTEVKNNIAFLSIPDYEDVTEDKKWNTKIIIKYKNADSIVKDITKQLENFDNNTLYFMKNLQKVLICGKPYEKKIDDNIIIIESSENENTKIPEKYYTDQEKKENLELHYDIKLVYIPGYSFENYPVYSYFRTEEQWQLPFLLHANFDLDSSRNRIFSKDGSKNEFILGVVLEYINKLIETIKIKTQQQVSWSPYLILDTHKKYFYNGSNTSVNSIVDTFFYRIDSLKDSLAVFPCLDNKYYLKNDARVYSNDFVDLLEYFINKYGNEFIPQNTNIIIKRPSKISLTEDSSYYYSDIEQLSELLQTIEEDYYDRAKLINYFSQYSFPEANDNSLFVDQNGELIPYEKECFYSDNVNEHIPRIEHIDICIINSDLIKILKEDYNIGFEDLRKMLSIKSYCINELIEKVVGDTKTLIKNAKNEQSRHFYAKSMYKFLHEIYSKNLFDTENLKEKILLPDNKLAYTDCSLYFDNEFSTNCNASLFIDYLNNSEVVNFIAGKSYWNFLDTKNDSEVLDYLKWLGVNEYPSVSIICEDFDCFISNFSRENILLLLYKFPEFKDEILTDKIKRKNLFAEFVINTQDIPFINDDNSDFKYLKAKSLNDEDQFKSILKLLGAKQEIGELSPKKLGEVIQSLYKNSNDPEGLHASKMYKIVLDKYKKSTEKFKLPVPIKYFSKRQSINAYHDNKEVYYYNDKSLPDSLLQEYAIISLSRRRGEKDIKNLFSVKTFDGVVIDIKKKEVNKDLSEQFMQDFEKFYPLILAQRINGIKDEKTVKRNATALLNLKVIICTDLSYVLSNDEFNLREMKDYDFLKDNKNIFYLKVPDNYKNIRDIRKNEIQLADFITEMLSIIFKIEEGSTDGALLNQNAGDTYIIDKLEYSMRRFEDEFGYEDLEKAKKLLGTIDYKRDFWRRVHTFIEAEHEFDIWYSKYKYQDVGSWDFSYTSYSPDMAALLEEFEIDQNLFFDNEQFVKNISFAKYNEDIFFEKYYEIYNFVEKYVWQNCKDKKQKEKFLSRRAAYRWEYVQDEFQGYNSKNINHEAEIWKLLSTKGINKDNCLKKAALVNIIIADMYQKNKDLFTEEEFEIINDYDKNSLLYFDDTIDELIEILKSKKTIKNELKNKLENSKVSELPTKYQKVEFVFDKTKEGEQNIISKSVHSKSLDEKKRLLGDKNEKLAPDILKEEYGYQEVIPRQDEGCGYDFECKKDGKTFFIEEKSFNGNSFIMTEHEYEVWKRNKDKFNVLLIRNNEQHSEIKGSDIEEKFDLEPNGIKLTLKKTNQK